MLQEVFKATKPRAVRTDIFSKVLFFSSVISEWNSLDINIHNSSSIYVFKKELLKFIRPEPNSTNYDIHDTKGLKLLTRLWLGIRHLGDYRFRHNIQDCVSPMYSCGQDTETTTHFFLHCPDHQCARKIILRQSDSTTAKIWLLRDNKLENIVLMSLIEFISFLINREIQLSLIRVNLNDSIVSLISLFL